MSEDLKWLIGLIISFAAAVGGFIVRDRQIMERIRDGDEKLAEKIIKVQADYVRREDLNSHIHGIETMIKEMREEQREMNRRIDAILTKLTNKI